MFKGGDIKYIQVTKSLNFVLYPGYSAEFKEVSSLFLCLICKRQIQDSKVKKLNWLITVNHISKGAFQNYIHMLAQYC